ncbi:hypothetical protein JAAARDRAFT_209987 [Jaapia argillacea MUCL 33604]|uniref:Uncharacterized protein n=1 Tax=Jaapia argillacea MUCL 33604 TaxID=933084 RepID=A0A067PPQ9_9AGAM|nr:hypothetical protein JAAARDRAFT_209987 [Jaapia argillacea MUCL 33604]
MGGDEGRVNGEKQGEIGITTRLTSPEPSLAGDISSPSHLVPPNVLITHPSRSSTLSPTRGSGLKPEHHPVAVLGLTRTRLDSLISTFSKQPTPAPAGSSLVPASKESDKGKELQDEIAAFKQTLVDRALKVQTLDGQMSHLSTQGSHFEGFVVTPDASFAKSSDIC